MKRKHSTLLAALFPLLVFSQVTEEDSLAFVGRQMVDSTKIESIEDIINEKEYQTTHANLIKHFDKVWKRRSYFNLAFNFSTLYPKGDIDRGDGNLMPNRKSDWGVSLLWGRNYRLHKKPIVNMIQFYIDFAPVDLCFSHYKIGDEGSNLYNSMREWQTEPDIRGNVSEYHYLPFDLEKFEGSYGLSVGPSVTILPFRYVGSNGLHFLKLNVYFRVGYQATILYMANEQLADVNKDYSSYEYNAMSNNLKMAWGHGLMSNFGVSLTWKGIGVGYEHRVANNKFLPISTRDFGDRSYNFKTSTDRIFISFRMGR